MKVMQKYFLALMPPDNIIEKVHEIKVGLREQFGIKYALKSPPHITLKMPFSYNEAKEDQLVASLHSHLKYSKAFEIRIAGVGTFGKRVVFLAVQKSAALEQLQREVSKFCKVRLHLTEELSDRNYHPHLTVAFKDIKESCFEQVTEFVSGWGIRTEFYAGGLALLKRQNGYWEVCKNIPF